MNIIIIYTPHPSHISIHLQARTIRRHDLREPHTLGQRNRAPVVAHANLRAARIKLGVLVVVSAVGESGDDDVDTEEVLATGIWGECGRCTVGCVSVIRENRVLACGGDPKVGVQAHPGRLST